MPTNVDMQSSVFVYARDNITGRVQRVAVPTDMQIGLTDRPAELQLLGRFSLNVSTYLIMGESSTPVSIHDTIVLVKKVTAPPSGTIQIKLPESPRRGQLYVIKDSSGSADVTSIAISSAASATIDGATSLTLVDPYSSAALFWNGEEWNLLVSSTGGGGGGGGDGDSRASYLVLSNTSSLTNERALTVTSGDLSLTDNGANSTANLGLATVSGVAGSYTSPTMTVDTKGRVTSIANGVVASGDNGAAYVVMSATASLSNERVLTITAGELTMSDGGANGNATLGLANTAVSVGSYLYANITVDQKGRLTAASSNPVPAPATSSYLLVSADPTLASARTVTNGVGLLGTDGGPGGSYNIGINNNIVATVSGTRFTGPVSTTGGLTGTLHNLISGLSYIAGGAHVLVASQANGQLRITGANQADRSATYLLMSTTASLENERHVSAGTGIRISDGGAGDQVTFSINNNVVATVSGTTFTGPVSASAGLSGSLQRIAPNLPYLLAGPNMSITTMSNGQIELSAATTAGSGDSEASYLVLSTTASLSDERAFVAGTGLRSTDAGANSTYTVFINDNVVATVSGTRFTGGVQFASSVNVSGTTSLTGSVTVLNGAFQTANSPATFAGGLTGTLHNLASGLSYIAAGDNVTVVSQSNGQLRISTVPSADLNATYIVVSTTGSLPNERVLTGGTGIRTTDAGSGGAFTLSINDNVVATVSGTRFTGPVNAFGGLSGSLHHLASGISYLVAGQNMSIVTQSNGQVTLTVNSTVDDDIVATVSGTRFTGRVWAAGGLTGSLQEVQAGLPYLLAGPNIALVTQSNGQIEISAGTEGGFGDPDASYLVLASTASLNSERVLTPGTGIRLVDAGANSSATLSINDNVVATVSGTRFTGNVVVTTGLSGSLQRLSTGISYLVAGDNMTVVTQSNGQILLIASASIDDDVVATVSGTRFTGPVSINNSTFTVNNSPATFNGGLTGTLHNLASGISYIAPGAHILLVSQSNGQLRITGANQGDKDASYIVIGSTASLPNERQLAGVVGQIHLIDGGAGSTLTVNLSTTGVVTGTYTYPTLTVDPRGRITSIANGVTPAPTTASYIVVGTDPTLTNERTLDAGLGLISVDGGPNASFSIAINNSVVATITGSTFTGPVSASGGLSGSLQLVAPGLPYLIGEGTVSVTTQSNGQVIIASYGGDAGSGADVYAPYIVVGNTGSLPNERALIASTGLVLTDNGANSTISLGINDNVVATVSGTRFTGPVSASAGLSGSLQMVGPNLTYLVAGAFIAVTSQSNGQVRFDVNQASILDDDIVATVSGTRFTGNVVATTGLSGSLQRLSNGLSYLVEGDNLTIQSQSNGQIVLSAGGDRAATYLVLSTTASLLNERVATAGTGIHLVDAGANSTATFSINDNVVATVSGTTFTGNVSASAGLSGSLQLVAPGLPYLLAGTNVDIVTQSNGQVVISANAVGGGGGSGDPFASYVVVGLTSSLANERLLSASTGLNLFDNGANNSIYFQIDNNVVATISGSTFTGATVHQAGLSGSLTRLTNGTSYLAAGPGIAITSQSNGQVKVDLGFPQRQEIPVLAGVERNDQDSFYAISAFELNLGGLESMIPTGSTGYTAYFQPIIEIYPTGALGVARLWNVTTLAQVSNSVLTGTSLTPTRLRTVNLSGSFATGSNIYEMQIRLTATSSSDYRVICKGAKLIMNWT